MTDDSVIRLAWPDWEAVEEIGEGTFGVVYRVRRTDMPDIEAAIKIIPVPTDRSEIDALRADGFGEEEIADYLRSFADDWLNEIRVMKKYQGFSHFVSMEDCKVLPRNDGIPGQWILIRMELLKSFFDYTSDKALTEPEVIDLGIQLCEALAVCHADGVLHRDIKPGNIFVNDRSESGVLYKLGDFGASRNTEHASGSLSMKGALNYMAPEVIRKQAYDRRSDLYSLGLTLYRLMNGNRLPFLPARDLFTHEDRETALRMRLMGTPLPPAADASDAMNRVLQRACAFDPADRYGTAEEFAKALRAASAGKAEKGRSRSRKRLWLGTALVLLGLAAAAALLIPRLTPKGPPSAPEQTPVPMIVVVDRR